MSTGLAYLIGGRADSSDTARFDIDRLEARLEKVLASLPPLTPDRPTDEKEHTPLFVFTKRVEALALRIDERGNALSVDKPRQQLAEVCESVGRRLVSVADAIDCEVTFAYETRAFMLKEAKKRVTQVAEDIKTEKESGSTPVAAVTEPRPSGGERSSLSSHSDGSRRSACVPIGSHPIHRSPSRHVGVNDAHLIDSTSNPFSTGNSPPMSSAPRIRDIIRLGSYQNAALFTGSPVAVALKRRFKDPPMATSESSSGGKRGSVSSGIGLGRHLADVGK